jgi:hypothetical protein
MFQVRNALLDARRRTGDQSLATSVQIGYFRVERVTYRPNGTSIVTPLTGWMKSYDLINYLNAI